ncbi:MAG: hypothetical protein JXA10_11460 [Anaerolineae bacterium]|nr:hypothetical protein [Anaerolineae bacterium]
MHFVRQNLMVWGCMLAVLAAGIGQPVRAQTDLHEGGSRFGIIGPADVTTLDQLGVGWVQLPFSWAAIQPDSADDWNADAIDADLIAAVVDSGREVVGVIADTPAWAAASGQPYAVPDGLWEPDAGNIWAGFVQRLVTEYAPLGVHHWIIYDEPNVRLGEGRVRFAGDVDDYARLLKVATITAKNHDPDAVIHLGALNWWVDDAAGRESYLARLLRTIKADPEAAARGSYFDVVTVRVTGNTAAVWRKLADARAILAAAAMAQPIWLEASVHPDQASESSALSMTPAQAADFVVHAAVLGLVAGVERIAVGDVIPARESAFFPLDIKHELAQSLVLAAYQTVIDVLAPMQRVTRYPHLAAELIVFEGAAQDVYVMWAVDQWAALFSITSNVEGEIATLIMAHASPTGIESQVIDWPAVFRVEVTPARRDANGFLTVAGSPVLLVLDRDTLQDTAVDAPFVRVTYMQVNGEWVRLR